MSEPSVSVFYYGSEVTTVVYSQLEDSTFNRLSLTFIQEMRHVCNKLCLN